MYWPVWVILLGLGHAASGAAVAQLDREDAELARVAAWVRTRAYDKIPSIDRPHFTGALWRRQYPHTLVMGPPQAPGPGATKAARRLAPAALAESDCWLAASNYPCDLNRVCRKLRAQ